MSTSTKALIASPLVILAASGTRLIVVSDYDTTTATTIAAANGAVGTLLGTTIPLLPVFLPAVFLLLVFVRNLIGAALAAAAMAIVSPIYAEFAEAERIAWDRWDTMKGLIDERGNWLYEHRYEWDRLDEWVGSVWGDREQLLTQLGPAWGQVMQDWRWQALLYAGGATVLAFLNGADRESRAGIIGTLVMAAWWRILWPVAVGFICFMSLALVDTLYRIPGDIQTVSEVMHRPWVPAEEVTTKSGERFVGYTMATKDGWFVLLTEPDREIRYFPNLSVTGRKVCNTEERSTRPKSLIPLAPIKAETVPRCRLATNSARRRG